MAPNHPGRGGTWSADGTYQGSVGRKGSGAGKVGTGLNRLCPAEGLAATARTVWTTSGSLARPAIRLSPDALSASCVAIASSTGRRAQPIEFAKEAVQ